MNWEGDQRGPASLPGEIAVIESESESDSESESLSESESESLSFSSRVE